MQAKNGNVNEQLEADARNALLAHFSSKSTNETAILVGLAVAFFADIQAYSAFNFPLTWQKITFLTFSLGMIAFFLLRQLSRLILWGQLADAVVVVKMGNKTEPRLRGLYQNCADRVHDLDEIWKSSNFWNRPLYLLIRQISTEKLLKSDYFLVVAGVWLISLLVAYAPIYYPYLSGFVCLGVIVLVCLNHTKSLRKSALACS